MIVSGNIDASHPRNRRGIIIVLLLIPALIALGYMWTIRTPASKTVPPPSIQPRSDAYRQAFLLERLTGGECSGEDCFDQVNALLTSLHLDHLIRDIVPLPERRVSVFKIEAVRFRVAPLKPEGLGRLTAALEQPETCIRISSLNAERLSQTGNALDVSITVQRWYRTTSTGGQTRDSISSR